MPNRKPCLTLCLILGLVLTACMETRQVRSTWDDWEPVGRPATDQRQAAGLIAGKSMAADQGYAILLGSFEGDTDQARRRAATLMAELRRQVGMSDVWARAENTGVNVYRGHFDAPDSPAAGQMLAQTRLVSLDGMQPYQQVAIVSLAENRDASLSDLDLRAYSGMYQYTLQVAVFDEAGGKNYRQLAEQYAQQLRAAGDDAYFYHGKFRSMVTLGLYTDADFVQEGNTQAYGPHIRALQERFPNNLVNGMTVVEKQQGTELGLQPSSLVRIP